jgi:hypothetical protein
MVQESEVIRCRINATRTALSEKLQELERQIMQPSAPTECCQEVAEEPHQSVKESVKGTMAQVKEAFDLPRQMQKHPWAILAGAAGLGLLGGFLIRRGTAPAAQPEEMPHGVNGSAPARPETATRLQEEIANLKSLAVGALLGVARDLVVDAVSRPLEEQLAEMIDALTTKLGGHPLQGRILPPRQLAECQDMVGK